MCQRRDPPFCSEAGGGRSPSRSRETRATAPLQREGRPRAPACRSPRKTGRVRKPLPASGPPPAHPAVSAGPVQTPSRPHRRPTELRARPRPPSPPLAALQWLLATLKTKTETWAGRVAPSGPKVQQKSRDKAQAWALGRRRERARRPPTAKPPVASLCCSRSGRDFAFHNR